MSSLMELVSLLTIADEVRVSDGADHPFGLSSVFLCALCVSVFALLLGSASIFRSYSCLTN